MPKIRAATVDEYIAKCPDLAQPTLHALRAILKEVVPDATEAIKWGYPAFQQKRILFSYSAHKDHLNFVPTRTTIEPFKEQLADYTIGRDTVQFPYNKPLPKALIRDMALYRLKEVAEDDSLWRHH